MSEIDPGHRRFIIISIVITALILATLFAIQVFRDARDEIFQRAAIQQQSGMVTPTPHPMVSPAERLPALFLLPEFELTERSGRTVGSEDLKGDVWVAAFFFTGCPGPCPHISQQMATLQDALEETPGVRLVSFTLDPERDTPEVLDAYAEHHNADADRWWFLTGDPEEIHTLSREGFRMTVEEAEDPQQIARHGRFIHGTRLVLVDDRNVVRGYYDVFDEESMAQLVEDARRLTRE